MCLFVFVLLLFLKGQRATTEMEGGIISRRSTSDIFLVA